MARGNGSFPLRDMEVMSTQMVKDNRFYLVYRKTSARKSCVSATLAGECQQIDPVELASCIVLFQSVLWLSSSGYISFSMGLWQLKGHIILLHWLFCGLLNKIYFPITICAFIASSTPWQYLWLVYSTKRIAWSVVGMRGRRNPALVLQKF